MSSTVAFFLMSSFVFNDTPTTEIYTLSLHDALPIYVRVDEHGLDRGEQHVGVQCGLVRAQQIDGHHHRSEEHTSELQSPYDLVCRLLLEKKNQQRISPASTQRRRTWHETAWLRCQRA